MELNNSEDDTGSSFEWREIDCRQQRLCQRKSRVIDAGRKVKSRQNWKQLSHPLSEIAGLVGQLLWPADWVAPCVHWPSSGIVRAAASRGGGFVRCAHCQGQAHRGPRRPPGPNQATWRISDKLKTGWPAVMHRLLTVVLLAASLPCCLGYCRSLGWNPSFNGPPLVEQVHTNTNNIKAVLCQQLWGDANVWASLWKWFSKLFFTFVLCPLWQTVMPSLTNTFNVDPVWNCLNPHIMLADSVISVCVCYKKGGRSDMKVAVALLWALIWAPFFPASTHLEYVDERFVVSVFLAMFKFVNYFSSVLCADMTIQLIFLTVIHLSKIFFESMNNTTKFGRLSLLFTIIHLICC